MTTKTKLALLCIWFTLHAITVTSQPLQAPVLINHTFINTSGLPNASVRIGKNFEWISNKNWSICKGKTVQFPADSTAWLYLSLKNTGSFDRFLKLRFHNVMLTKADLYLVADGKIVDTISTGYALPFHQRASPDRDMSLPISIRKGQILEVYISLLRRALPNSVSLDIVDSNLEENTNQISLALATTIGFCTLMWLTAIVLAIYRRTKENLYYALYATGGTMYLIAAHGFGSQYLWPELPWFQETAPVFWVSLGIIGFVQLARHVLQIKQHAKWVDVFSKIAISIAISFILYGWAMSLSWAPTRWYASFALLCGAVTAILLTLIFIITLQRALIKKQNSYWWFAGIFISLYLLSLATLADEAGLLPMRNSLLSILVILAVPLEMFMTQVFLATYIMGMIIVRQKRELKLVKENEQLALDKAQQQRLYSNMVHEIIKGEVESLLVEVDKKDAFIRQQLQELAEVCRLGQLAFPQEPKNLFQMMKEIEFIYATRLHSEEQERYFYSEIDPQLNDVYLPPGQTYELTFFLRECMNNLRKYAQYHYASFKVKLDQHNPSKIKVEVIDDGIGLSTALNLEAAQIEIDPNNWNDFFEKHLAIRRKTGIKALFDKADRLPGSLHISSTKGKGTCIQLEFFPNSG